MSDRWVYLDASAFVKLVLDEPESEALRRYLERRPRRTSCGLLRTEAARAIRPHGERRFAIARHQLARLALMRRSPALLEQAGCIQPLQLRTLDAVHLAAAASIGRELVALVTYDLRMAAAAAGLRLPVAAPA